MFEGSAGVKFRIRRARILGSCLLTQAYSGLVKVENEGYNGSVSVPGLSKLEAVHFIRSIVENQDHGHI